MLETIHLPLRDEKQLAASLDQTLTACPADPAQGMWLFVYGLLAYDPPFGDVTRQVVTLDGFRRRFCLADTVNRGTPEDPGLTIGLTDAGGDACTGLAYRLDGDVRKALQPVWQQEMMPSFYTPTWMVHDGLPMLVFVTDRDSPALRLLYDAEEAAIIRTSEGSAGTNSAYLENVRTAFARANVYDAYLERLAGLTGQAAHSRQHAGESVTAVG